MSVLDLMRRLDPTVNHDPAEARHLRDESIKAAHDHAHKAWLDMAEQCVRHCAQYLDEYTNDDVQAEIEHRCKLMRDLGAEPPSTHEPRALGAVTRKLVRAGLIEKTGRYVTSNRKSNHAQPIPVWRRATQ